ncbi:MAG: PDZ domain-containing protein [bacterium]|nr:PDZ domain-containing protein [bacterium]
MLDYCRYILYISLLSFSISLAIAEEIGFGGLGIQISQDGNRFTILGVLPNTPAEKAELPTGASIVAINGEPTAGKTLEEIVAQLRGEVGTSVRLTITIPRTDPASAETREIELRREFIKVPPGLFAPDTTPRAPSPSASGIPIRGSVTFYIITIPKSGEIKIGTTTLIRLMLENPKGVYADKIAMYLKYDPHIFHGYTPLFDINTVLLAGWTQETVAQDTTSGSIYFAFRTPTAQLIKSGCLAEIRLIPHQATFDTQIQYLFNEWEREPNTVFIYRGKDLLGSELDHNDGTMGVRLRINKD